MKKILAIIGSTKNRSTNWVLVKALQELAADKADIIIYDEITALPFFNPDLDNDTPPAVVVRLREQIAQSDAVIISTPEYVFSLPGVLKNALEWMVSTRVFAGKPVALLTAAASGEKAHESLQLIMKTIEAKFDESTSLLIQGAKGKIGKDERPNEETTGKLSTLIQSLFKST
jgi:NAD(P)H-dependent FMN reductase